MAKAKLSKSDAKNKKYKLVFEKEKGKTKTIHFGATGYLDYTIGATDEQRKNYRSRHSSGATASYDTPNAASYHILWGNSKSVQENFKAYKNKYNLD